MARKKPDGPVDSAGNPIEAMHFYTNPAGITVAWTEQMIAAHADAITEQGPWKDTHARHGRENVATQHFNPSGDYRDPTPRKKPRVAKKPLRTPRRS